MQIMFALALIVCWIMHLVGGALNPSLILLSIPSVRGTWMTVDYLIASVTTELLIIFIACILGNPPGHAFCGNWYVYVTTILAVSYMSHSENLLALRAPSTTKCDFCQVSFCGIGIQGRCLAAPLLSQHPHNMSDVGDLIQSSEVYGCFDNNTVEVEIMLDYLTAQELTPRHIYREVSNILFRSRLTH
jgi:hypothetical protein